MADSTKVIVQLRGEIGEIILSWTLLRHFLSLRSQHSTGDLQKDMESRELWFLNALIDKLQNEIISRLSELADKKARGQLTFSNGSGSLNRLGHPSCKDYVERFRTLVVTSQFDKKRNNEISHKAFIEKWDKERAPIHVTYASVLRALGMAVLVMKRMDEQVDGKIHSRFMWRELRNRRYSMTMLPRAAYMIAEHIHIPEAIRAQIINDEIRKGRFHQELIDTVVNGVNVQIYASKKWGAINLGGHLLILKQYPLQKLERVDSPEIVVDPAWLGDLKNSTTPAVDSSPGQSSGTDK